MALNHELLTSAVIGLGFIGAGDQVSGDAIGQRVVDLDGTHAAALANHPAVRLVAGSSRDEGRRRRFEQQYQVHKTYADWRQLLAQEKLDIVCVATNSPHHAAITSACAEAGVRAVLCEKPITTRLSDADRVIQSCQEHGTILIVNHSRRWHPLWHEVRREIRSGAIGDVRHVVVQWPTGRLGNVGTHIFDLLRMLLDREAAAVSGRLDTVVPPDCRGAQFHDPGGWGTIQFTHDVKAFIDAREKGKLPFMLRLVGSLGQVSVGKDRASIQRWSGDERTLPVSPSNQTSLDRAVHEIVGCLTQGEQPTSTGEDGRAALEIIIGLHVSDRLRGQWVSLPITGPDRELDVAIG